MCRAVRSWLIAGLVAMADMVVFIHCIPIICEAWGANRWFMVCLFVLMIVWIESLANVWRFALQGMVRDPEVLLTSPVLATPQETYRGGETNV